MAGAAIHELVCTVCACVRMLCACVCMNAPMRARVWVCARWWAGVSVCMRMYVHMYAHVGARMYTYVNTNSYT
jgi:hypothetical protein